MSIQRPDFTSEQWYLRGPAGAVHLNLDGVWSEFTGRGVAVGIWDDGVEYSHWDLSANYDASRHIVVDGRRHVPDPSDGEGHGTAVAGIIAAASDGQGITGVAHGARITGVDLLSSSPVSFGDSFPSLRDFDVTNHSYWNSPFIYDQRDPWYLANINDGLVRSVDLGRGGLGTINVFCAGNGRQNGVHTGTSALTTTPEAIAVAAVGYDGFVTAYSTPGAGLLVSAPSGDDDSPGIWTTDLMGWRGYAGGSWGVHPAFVTDFSGTSAAAPMVAGVAALMLEANPRLGWRDVQEILAHTARHVGSPIGGGPVEDEAFSWSFNGATTWNGGGLHFSNDYGFGLVDARAAVRLAESWRQQQTSTTFATEIETWRGVRPVDRLGAPVLVDFETEADLDLEMVGIELVPSAGVSIAEYRVTLTSPSGTESVLATPVRGVEQLTGWIFGSRAFLGEEAEGTWTLTVSDGIRNGPGGALLEARLYLLGGDGDAPRTHVFTDAFSDYVDAGLGHGRTIVAGAGGADGLNTAAVRGGVGINIAEGTGRIDGEAVRLAGTFARVDTGDGADLIVGGAASELLAGWRGNDVIRGNGGSDRLIGAAGRDRLEGGAGNDMLFAGGGPDSVFGGRGPDRLIGGAGNDRLHGGPGRDVLADGEGADILFGGTDADRFVLVRDGQRDAIRDFEDGLDRIELAGPGFGALVRETLEPGRVLVRSPGDVLLVEDGGAGQLRARDLGSEDFLFA